ncbi:hypothetical protein D9M72_543950 [compost metagenome]
MALAMPNAALSITCQRSRTCESGNRSAMQAKAVPTSMPPPMPCSARASTRNGMLVASPHSAEATVNTTIDASTKGLRP